MIQLPTTQVPLTPGVAPADGNGNPTKPDNIRTYRGRRLEDLIPQIRAELGHDAIILRERQGVTGGIGGFFAQRCVEVDAQPTPRVNVYADDSDAEFADIDVTAAIATMTSGGSSPATEPTQSSQPSPAHHTAPAYEAASAYEPAPAADMPVASVYEPAPMPELVTEIPVTPVHQPARAYEPASAVAPEPAVAETAPAPVDEPAPVYEAAPVYEPVQAYEPVPTYEPSPVLEPVAMTEAAEMVETEPIAELSFATSLEQAEISVEDEPVAETIEPEPAMETIQDEPVMETIQDEPIAETVTPEAVAETITHEPIIETYVWPTATKTVEPELVMETIQDEPVAETIEPEPAMETIEPEPVMETIQDEPVAETIVPEPVFEALIPDLVAELVQPEPEPEADDEPVAETIEPEPVMETIQDEPVAATIPADWSFIAFDELTSLEPVVSDQDLAADAIGTAEVTTWTNEIVHGESAWAWPTDTTDEPEAVEEPVAGPDPDVEARIAQLEEHLLDTGFSAARTRELIATASENLDSTSDRSAFEDALHAAIVSALPAPRSLPVGAIAVVGAGGSGKTRCVAALASAHARVVVVPVNVAKLGTSDSELTGMLRGEAVTVLGAGSSDELGEAIGTARDGGLVIVDTEAVAPSDTETMDSLARSIGDLELDGIYLAVPATLSPRAAAKLAQGYSSLALTGLIATHVDEGDQLGMVAELAMSTGTPIGYAHAGTDLHSAILSTHREQLAARLLA